eukprot:14405703-Ditylum_brightwellii.AAC.1
MGPGALKHFNLKSTYNAEDVIIGLEQALGYIGSICVGIKEVVDHHCLSSAGYCFSTSELPFMDQAVLASLTRLQNADKQ